MTADHSPALSLRNVTKRFGGIAAVDDVSFDVAGGTICGLVGPNGAGKTTLINVVSGFERASSGRVRLAGQDITGRSAVRVARRGLVRTFQHPHAFSSMTCQEALTIACAPPPIGGPAGLLPRARREEVRTEVGRVLEFLGLQRWASAPCGDLPHGVKKRLGMGLALVGGPAVLLLDEPAAGLNSAETEALLTTLEELRHSGMTVLIVEHSMPLIRAVCDSMVVLDHGLKITDGAPEVVLEDDRVVGAYLGRR